MPLPEGVETVTVSTNEPLTLPDGTPFEGKLLFAGPDLLTIGEDDSIIGGTAEAPLVDGQFTKELVATDASGMTPTGWTYRVTSKFTNAPNWVGYVSLPKDTPAVLLSDVLVPDPVAGEHAVLVSPDSLDIPQPASSVTAETSFGQSSATGTSTAYARQDHTHGTPALPSLDQLGTPAGNVAMGGHKLTGLGDGAAASDAATVGQLPAPGATAETYAAGNDPRLSDARPPTGGASGDLSGAYPAPSVAKVNGVAVTGTPTAGQVPTATSGTAASWQTPAAPPAASDTPTGQTSFGQAATAGSATSYARGDHAHGTPPMPRLDQVGAPTADVAMSNRKLTGLANGSAASDAAAFGQIPTAGTGGSNYAAGNDSRITGAAQKAANLTDLASAPAARAALGMVDPVPADYGLVTWSYPPWGSSSSGPGNAGFIYYMRVLVPVAATITGVRLYQTAAGATLTSGQCFAGLVDSSGNRVRVSADQSTAWASGTQTNKDVAFTSQYSAAAGYYWVPVLFNGTTGPSWPKGAPSGTANAGWSSAPFPALISGSGQTSLPASVTLSSLSTVVSAFWVSLY